MDLPDPGAHTGASQTSRQPLRRDIESLLAIMRALRTPRTGCAWDVAQTFETIAPYTLEEAYEVVDAIERRHMGDLCDELGDLLLQVVFHARMAEEAGAFAFADVVGAIVDKLVRRHPHVFGVDVEGTRALDAGAIQRQWADIKARERATRGGPSGVLDDVPTALPALSRAVKLQRRAADVGFDWPDMRGVLAKIREECDEVETELAAGASADRVADEIGDLFFALTNLARHAGVDPESATRAANAKFARRFGAVERALVDARRPLPGATLDEMEAIWTEVKRREG